MPQPDGLGGKPVVPFNILMIDVRGLQLTVGDAALGLVALSPLFKVMKMELVSSTTS